MRSTSAMRVVGGCRAQRRAQRDDARLELTQREAVLALPGVARHELALDLLAPRLGGHDAPCDRRPFVQRVPFAVVLEEQVEDLEMDGLELAPARLHPLLVRIVVEEPAGVELVGGLQQRQRSVGRAPARLAGEALELAHVVPQLELGRQRVAAVLEDDVLHVAVDLAQEPAQRVHRTVEVVARGRRPRVGPEHLHEHLTRDGPVAVQHEVLQQRLRATARPRTEPASAVVDAERAQTANLEGARDGDGHRGRTSLSDLWGAGCVPMCGVPALRAEPRITRARCDGPAGHTICRTIPGDGIKPPRPPRPSPRRAAAWRPARRS